MNKQINKKRTLNLCRKCNNFSCDRSSKMVVFTGKQLYQCELETSTKIKRRYCKEQFEMIEAPKSCPFYVEQAMTSWNKDKKDEKEI